MTEIYATGSSGLIGSKLVGVNPIRLDLLDSRTFNSLELRKSTVVHLAGIVGEETVKSDFDLAYKVNVSGTIEFARFILEKTDSRFLFVSSSHVYKASNMPHKESDEISPLNVYAGLKWEAERALRLLYRTEPKRLCIARVFSVLGPGMPIGTLGWAIENLSQDSPLNNCDDERDFLAPKEIAGYLTHLAKTDFKFPVVNICSGKSSKVGDACIKLRTSLGLQTPLELLIRGNSKIPWILGDNSRLLSL